MKTSIYKRNATILYVASLIDALFAALFFAYGQRLAPALLLIVAIVGIVLAAMMMQRHYKEHGYD